MATREAAAKPQALSREIERRAMLEAGVDAKERILAEARHKLAVIDDTVEQKREMLRKVDAARAALVAGDSDPVYNEALTTVAAADAEDSLANLYAEARRTPTGADEVNCRPARGNRWQDRQDGNRDRRPSPRSASTCTSPRLRWTRFARSSAGRATTTRKVPSTTRVRSAVCSRTCSRGSSAVAYFGTSCGRDTGQGPLAAALTSACRISRCRFQFPVVAQAMPEVASGAIRLVVVAGRPSRPDQSRTMTSSLPADPSEVPALSLFRKTKAPLASATRSDAEALTARRVHLTLPGRSVRLVQQVQVAYRTKRTPNRHGAARPRAVRRPVCHC